MKRLLHIAMCFVAAFLMVPVEGDCSEITEFELETEVMLECVRSTVSEDTLEPTVRLVRATMPRNEQHMLGREKCTRPVSVSPRIVYCVFRE